MNNQTKICVISINYRAAAHTAACVASLMKSTVPLSTVAGVRPAMLEELGK